MEWHVPRVRRMTDRTYRRTRVDPERWKDAQAFEEQYWARAGRHRPWLRAGRRFLTLVASDRKTLLAALRHRDLFFFGDDYHYWWLERFGGYSFLPTTVGYALEVGSGPQSNLRVIERHTKIDRLVVSDPLMVVYSRLKGSWVGWMHRRGRLFALADTAEALALRDRTVDLICCINVLDHCRDARAAIVEMSRVLRPGGVLLLATDLVNERDVRLAGEDRGHPLRLDHELLDEWVRADFQPVVRKVLPRSQTRVPTHHYGAYVFAGVKRDVEGSRRLVQ